MERPRTQYEPLLSIQVGRKASLGVRRGGRRPSPPGGPAGVLLRGAGAECGLGREAAGRRRPRPHRRRPPRRPPPARAGWDRILSQPLLGLCTTGIGDCRGPGPGAGGGSGWADVGREGGRPQRPPPHRPPLHPRQRPPQPRPGAARPRPPPALCQTKVPRRKLGGRCPRP